MRESQSFSFHALRELGLALRSSRRELSDGTLVTFQILREGPFTCSPLVCGRRQPESSPSATWDHRLACRLDQHHSSIGRVAN